METTSWAWQGLWGSTILSWYSYCWKNSNIYKACNLSAGFYHDFLPTLHSSGMLSGRSLWLHLPTASFFPNPSLKAVLKSSSAHDVIHLVIPFLRHLLLGTVGEKKVTYYPVFQVWQLLLWKYTALQKLIGVYFNNPCGWCILRPFIEEQAKCEAVNLHVEMSVCLFQRSLLVIPNSFPLPIWSCYRMC